MTYNELTTAIIYRNEKELKKLLKNGADCLEDDDLDGVTPYAYAKEVNWVNGLKIMDMWLKYIGG